MIRFVRNLIWLRWRSLVNTVRGTRRDEAERLARIGALLVRVIVVLLFAPSAVALTVAGFVGGGALARGEPVGEVVIVAARAILAAVTLAVLFGPLLRTMGGIEPELRRLLLMPIPRRALFAADSIASVIDPWIVPPLLALFAVIAGVAAGGAPGVALVAGGGALAFVGALVALGSLAGSATTLLFRGRRRAEWASFALVLGITLVAFAPSLFDQMDDDASTRARLATRLEQVTGWLAPLPSEQCVRVLGSALEGRSAEAAGRLGLVVTTALALLAGAATLHRRLLDGVESAGSTRRRGSRGGRGSRLPWVGAAISEVALTVVRTSLRTVRGRIAVFFTAIVVALIWVGCRSLFDQLTPRWLAVQGPLLVTGGGAFAALALQPLMLNQFAIDGPGLTLGTLLPLTPRQLVRGKLLGHVLLAGGTLVSCIAIAVVVVRAGDPRLWTAATLAALAGLVGLVPIGALLSIALPKASDLSRIGHDGNPHQLAGLLGAIASALVIGASTLSWVVPGVLLDRPGLSLAAAATGLVVACVAAWPLSNLASGAFARRQENLCLVASGR